MARIIIVEDDDLVSEIASMALSAAGHMTSEVADGALAVEAIRTAYPDLVILDYNLPGETGLDILREMRQMAHAEKTPVLMLTASGSRLLKARAEFSGVDDYLVKPFVPEELVRRVEMLLADRGAAAAADPSISRRAMRG